MKMSTGVEAMKMPESPPMTNIETKASAFSIGVVKLDVAAPERAEPVERLDRRRHAR